MKKRAKLTGHVALIYREMICPFCGTTTTENPLMPWCSHCTVEYVIGATGKIVFDDQRKTPKYEWGKLLNRAGGVRIGRGGKP